MRIVALWFFLQTVVILSVMGAVFGQLLLFFLIGASVGAATAASTCITWVVGRSQLEDHGFRW
jgi:hypothetical protein